DISANSEKINSFSSILAFTAGHSFKAVVTAFVKKDIKPSPISCFSLKISLYLLRKSMMGFILTSLKVVNIAVSFFTETNRFAIVRRRELIFSRLSFLLKAVAIVEASVGLDS